MEMSLFGKNDVSLIYTDTRVHKLQIIGRLKIRILVQNLVPTSCYMDSICSGITGDEQLLICIGTVYVYARSLAHLICRRNCMEF